MTALPKKNARTGVVIAGIAAAMLGLAYASVPLYELFCQVTGFGGATQISETAAPGAIHDGIVREVRFNAKVMPELDWKVTPAQPVTLTPGEEIKAIYTARNTGDEVLVGTSAFNVTPNKVGPHFMKIECFCFTEQVLAPGEEIEMPVIFFLNPTIDDDRNTVETPEITLSYTFFKVDKTASATSAVAAIKE